MSRQQDHPTASDLGAMMAKGANAQSKLAERMWNAALKESVLLDELGVELLSEPRRDSGNRLITSWLHHHQLFALDLPDVGIRYPAFQFQFDATPWPVLAEVLPRLQAVFDSRDLLIWFNSPHPTLQGDKPRTRLDQPGLIAAAVDDTLKPVDFY
jgi:hypothetical protein